MLSVDVNVLVYAHRPESDRHDEYLTWLDVARTGAEPLVIAGPVISGFMRVVTHPRIFIDPTPTAVAAEFVEILVASPAVSVVVPGQRHVGLFLDLCRRQGSKGNEIPDAYLAAFAIETGATWVTADRGFARFPDLRWKHPLDH